MIFLTVGTQFPFDRLVRAVDEILGNGGLGEEVFGQIGDSRYKPSNFEVVTSLDKMTFDEHFRQASAIISHAGMGTISMALEHHKPLLALPRLKKYGEVVNNHQVAIAKKFEELGHILVAYQEDQLSQKIRELKSFLPRTRQIQTKTVTNRIAGFLWSLTNESVR